MHGTAYKKTKNLQPVISIIDVFDCFYEDNLNDEVYEMSHTDVESSIAFEKNCANQFFKHKYINSNKLQKTNEIIRKGDVVEVMDCYGWKGTNLHKCCINFEILQCKFNKWLDYILVDREITFKVIIDIEKRHPVAKRKLMLFIL